MKLLRTKRGYKTGIRIGIKGWSDFVFWVTFLRPPHFHRRHVLLTFRGTRANCCTTRNGRARPPSTNSIRARPLEALKTSVLLTLNTFHAPRRINFHHEFPSCTAFSNNSTPPISLLLCILHNF